MAKPKNDPPPVVMRNAPAGLVCTCPPTETGLKRTVHREACPVATWIREQVVPAADPFNTTRRSDAAIIYDDPALQHPTTREGPTVALPAMRPGKPLAPPPAPPPEPPPPVTRAECHTLASLLRDAAVAKRRTVLAQARSAHGYDLDAIDAVGRLEAAAKAVMSWSGRTP